jgi:signal transduction histidine kinase
MNDKPMVFTPLTEQDMAKVITEFICAIAHDSRHLTASMTMMSEVLKHRLEKNERGLIDREACLDIVDELRRSIIKVDQSFGLLQSLTSQTSERMPCDFLLDIIEPAITRTQETSKLKIKIEPSVRSLPLVLVNQKVALCATILLFGYLEESNSLRIKGTYLDRTVRIELIASNPLFEHSRALRTFAGGYLLAGFHVDWQPDRKGLLLSSSWSENTK